MPWNPALNQLRDALAELYADVADAKVVAASALLSYSGIATQGKPRTVWQSILEEAAKQECVEAVIAAAMAEYGRNPALVAAVEAYRRSTSGQPPSGEAGVDSRSQGGQEERAGGATNHAQVTGSGNIVVQGGGAVATQGGVAVGGNVEGGVRVGKGEEKEEGTRG
jgi:hypothetical protein